MSRKPPPRSLQVKVETAFKTYLESRVSRIPIVAGHDSLTKAPEKCVLVWAQGVSLYNDMPASTGCRVVTLAVRIDIPDRDRAALLDQAIADVSFAMESVDDIRQELNLGLRSKDVRPVRGFHVYDVDPSNSQDENTDDYHLEQLVYSVLCGEHDG